MSHVVKMHNASNMEGVISAQDRFADVDDPFETVADFIFADPFCCASANYANSQASRYRRSNNPRYRHQKVRRQVSDHNTHALTLRTIMLLCGIMGAVLAIGFALHLSTETKGLFAPESLLLSEAYSLNDSGNIESTPISEWRKGSFPYLYQIDKQWADIKYADGEIATYGCGPTCLSMVYVYLTGNKDKSPVNIAEFSENNGYIDHGVTSWLLMSEGSASFGLKAKEVAADANQIRLELTKGHPIICSVGEGDFTTSGHFIVLTGISEGGSKVEIRDPNSVERSHQTWEIERILPQCRNIWSFTA